AALLEKLGLKTLGDLVAYYPSDYEQFSAPSPIREMSPGEIGAVRGRIESEGSVYGFGKNAILSFRIRDDSGSLRISYFHAPYMKKQIHRGAEKIFRGRIRDGGKYGLSMDQPEMWEPQAYEGQQGRIFPLYRIPKGISLKRFRKAMEQALSFLKSEEEILPASCLKENAMSRREALSAIHFPSSALALREARDRLVLEEFMTFILQVRLMKGDERGRGNPCPMPGGELTEKALRSLPFPLTKAQERALSEIRADLQGEKRMSRLLQGDVGSGKTIVALLALLQAVSNGYQGALMAPTEVLAEQHYEKISRQLAQWGLAVNPVLLTSSVKASEKKERLKQIAEGKADLIIGTHALIQEAVQPPRLGLVVTDEQHRFGVRQRGLLAEKGLSPHMLVMSATPIPRTLAIILYGDLDVSVLDELPAGRRPIKNAVVPPSYRERAYRLMLREAAAGRQSYIICPLVEAGESLRAENVEEYYEQLRSLLPAEIPLGKLHGRMKPEEKNRIMREFAAGRIMILVATTVVEVGVDVPRATVMMVENAERFGLAQLHQLRGRVGRGQDQSYAVFVDGSGKKEINRRLEVMKSTNDGFRIAEEDLKLRGPGDLFGIRQSGDMHFPLGDIYRDHGILLKAAELAGQILEKDPLIQAKEHSALRRHVLQYQQEGVGL
ncbi:MAG: ATP-dependent DNA helicase RecG, partial [Lachnospiraceae bacterium]|nr:ATP-dependent DNA helicase RecG [Lachnospiraceae bacterium]